MDINNNELTIKNILDEWSSDSAIDELKITFELTNTPRLHAKYLRYYHTFKSSLIESNALKNKLLYIKRKYYRGELTKSDLDKYNWNQYEGLKMSSSEFNNFIETDPDVIKATKRIEDMELAVKSLEYILKDIGNRNLSIKSIIEYKKFLNGN